MPIIKTGAFNRYTVYREQTDDGYVYHSDSSMTVGRVGNCDYRIYCEPATGDLFSVETEDIVTLKLKLTVKKKTDIYSESLLWLRFYDSADSPADYTTALWRWESISETALKTELVTLSQGTQEQEVEVMIPSSRIGQVLSAGVGIMVVQDEGDPVVISSCSLEGEVVSVETPPVLTLDFENLTGGFIDGEGVYVHYADRPMNIAYTATQEKGAAVSIWSEVISNRNEEGGVAEWTRGTPLKIPPSRGWSMVPCEGTLRFFAKTAYAESESIEIPFRILYCDVVFSSPVTGDVISAAEDLTIWAKIINNTGYDDAPTPSMIDMEYGISGENLKTSVGMGGSSDTISYTIPMNEIEKASGQMLEILLHAWFGGSGELVEQEEGEWRRLLLYVQSEAETSGLAVSPIWDVENNFCASVINLSWNSVGQTAYQYKIDKTVYSPVWGTATSAAVPGLFSDGEHRAQIRIQDTNGIWSDWSLPVFFKVSNMIYAYLSFNTIESVERDEDLAVITMSIRCGDTAILYRNGAPVMLYSSLGGAHGSDLIYIDRTANGVCTYELVTVGDAINTEVEHKAYVKTAAVSVDMSAAYDRLTLADGSILPLRYTSDFPSDITYNRSEETSQLWFNGRSYPVSFRSGKRTRAVSLNYCDPDKNAFDALEGAEGDVVFFRDRNGGRMKAEISGISISRSVMGSTVSFALTEVDWKEEVLYEH